MSTWCGRTCALARFRHLYRWSQFDRLTISGSSYGHLYPAQWLESEVNYENNFNCSWIEFQKQSAETKKIPLWSQWPLGTRRKSIHGDFSGLGFSSLLFLLQLLFQNGPTLDAIQATYPEQLCSASMSSFCRSSEMMGWKCAEETLGQPFFLILSRLPPASFGEKISRCTHPNLQEDRTKNFKKNRDLILFAETLQHKRWKITTEWLNTTPTNYFIKSPARIVSSSVWDWLWSMTWCICERGSKSSTSCSRQRASLSIQQKKGRRIVFGFVVAKMRNFQWISSPESRHSLAKESRGHLALPDP